MAVSLEVEGHRDQGDNGWLGSETVHCLKGIHPWGVLALLPSRGFTPDTYTQLCPGQQNQLTDLRPPDLSKMSRARELKA